MFCRNPPPPVSAVGPLRGGDFGEAVPGKATKKTKTRISVSEILGLLN
jgi:hypothetical protein